MATDYPSTKLPFQEAYDTQIAKCQGPLHVPYQPNLLEAMIDGLPQDVLIHLSSQIEAYSEAAVELTQGESERNSSSTQL